MNIPTRSMQHRIHDQSSKRVSKQAANQLGKIPGRFSSDIAEEAIAIVQEDGYQTGQREHVRQALNG